MRRGSLLWHRKQIALRKFFALALCFSFILTPLEVAFAQDAGTETAATDSGSSTLPPTPSPTPTPPPSADFSIPGVDSSVPSTDGSTDAAVPDSTTPPAPPSDSAPASDSSAPATDSTTPTDGTTPAVDEKPTDPEAQSFSSPDAPNFVLEDSSGKRAGAQPDFSSGALLYKIALETPPGRSGIEPNLELQYSNQVNENQGVFGYGWTVNIPYIVRLNKTGTERMLATTSNYFYSSLSGELATTTSPTTFVSRVDSGDFLQYTFNNNKWVVVDKKGVRYTFGTSTLSRQDDPNDSTRIYKWMLEEIRDTNNNYIKYQYYKDGGQIYPATITYTGNGTTDGPFVVNFLRESRSDTATSSAQAGFAVTTRYRINEINTMVSGTQVRKYALTYGTGDNGYRSMLSSVAKSGTDNMGNATTLPATTFLYQTSSSSHDWSYDGLSMPTSMIDNAPVVVDLNGDGLPDVTESITHGPGGNSINTWLNDGNGGWTDMGSTSVWRSPVFFNNGSPGMADLNGDGLVDVYDSFAATGNQVWLNNGNGWTLMPTTTWQMPIDLGQGSPILIDVNGDALPDVIENGSLGNHAYINNGDGSWTDESSTWSVPISTVPQSAGGTGGAGDLNGDGLPDLFDSRTGLNVVYLNTGHGWVYAPDWHMPDGFDNYGPYKFLDVNGDGLTDVLRCFQAGSLTVCNTFVNNGDGNWTDYSGWHGPFAYNNYGSDAQGTLDINGDLMPDIYLSSSVAQINQVYTNTAKKADQLIGIQNPFGGSSAVTYKTTPQYKDGSGNLLNPSLPYIISTVSNIAVNDGNGTVGTTTYEYQGGANYFASPLDHKLAGFGKITTTDPAGNVSKSYFHQGNTSDTSHGEYQDGFAKIGRIYRTEEYSGSSNLLRKTINKWDASVLASGANFVKLTQSVKSDYGVTGTHRDIASTYAYENTFGNLFQEINYGEVAGNDDGTFSDSVSGDLSSTTVNYVASTSPYIVGLRSNETTQNESGSKVREVRHYYDGLSLGNVDKGNETKTESWITASTYASTTKVYDGTYGLVVQARDADYNLSTSTLDSYHLYVATTTNPLFQTTGYTYDFSTGNVKTRFDANGRLYSTSYDGIGRPLTVNEPDPSTGALVAKTTYAYTDSNTPGSTSVLKTDYLSSATTSATYTYFDGLNRNLQQRKQAKGNNTYAVKDWTYNNVGLLSSESLPYFASSTARSSATSTPQLFTTFTYDALQRGLKTSNAVGSTTNAYNAWTVTTTDANGKVKDYTKDPYGNLATVVEQVGGQYATTTYAWDLNKSLTKLTDALGNVRNFTYDGLGHRLSAQDLHAPSDGTYGSSSYTYDAAGNHTQTVDAKSQTINYGYDALNRKTTEDYTGQAGTEITNTYDTCTDGKSRLCIASSTSSQIKYAYNPLGLQMSATSTLNGTSTAFTTKYGYDRQGNKTLITYPDNAQVQYNYNSAGLPDAVLEKENGGSFSYIVNNFDYSPLGQPSSIVMSNGAVTTNTYDQNSLYRLTRKVTALSNGNHAQDLTYTHDALGNITRIIDNGISGSGKIVSYAYDDLSRLLNASTTIASSTPYSYSYTHDALGNITSGPLGSYSYLGNTGSNYADPDAVTAVATSTGSGSVGVSTSTIAFDATSTSITTTTNGTTTKTWTHTVTGTNPVIVLTADISQNVAGIGSIASASWNGGSFTKATSTRKSNVETEIWYLVATSSGAKIMSVTINGTTTSIVLGAESFTGVSTSSPFEMATSSNGSGGNPSVSVTPGNTTDVVVATLSKSGGGSGSGGGTSTSTPALITSAAAGAGSDSVTTAAIDTTGANFIVMSVAYNTGATPTISDSKGNTWTPLTASTVTASVSERLYYAANATVGSGHTFSNTAASNFSSICVEAFSGVATSSPFDKENGATSSASTIQPGSVTPSVNQEALVTGLGWNVARTTYPPTIDSSFTVSTSSNFSSGNHYGCSIGQLVQSNAAAVNPTWNLGSVQSNAARIATFKPLVTVSGGGSFTSADATSSQTTLWKNATTSFFGGASYKIATTSGTITDTYTTATSTNWVMAAIALRPATTTSVGSGPVSTTTLTYDNNGNLTTEGSTTYSWDYRNHLTQAGNGTATSSYAYDDQDNRVKLTEGGATTFFPNTLYSAGATTTKNIFANGMLVGTIESTGSSSGGGGTSTSTIAFDATSTSITLGLSGTITKTWTHTVTGTNPIIVLTAGIWQDIGGTGTISSASWNGAAFTKATSTRTSGIDAEVWYLVASTTGAKTMSVTVTGNTDAIKLSATSFTGVSPTATFDLVKSANDWSSAPSVTITPTTATGLVVATLARWTTNDATTSKSALFKDYAGSILAAASYTIATTSGAITDAYTVAGGGNQDWVMAAVAFRPATTTSGGGGGVSSASTTMRYLATDNISGSNIVMDASSTVVEALDYYPYGGQRIDTRTNYGGVRNKYAGTVYDGLSGLNYMQARYQNSSRGQFVSEDPSFLAVGDQGQLKQVTGQDQTTFLADPQQMNSYGYGRDNPITRSDPSGNSSQDAFLFALSYNGNNSGVAAAKQQALAQLQAGAQGYAAGAKASIPLILSVATMATFPSTVPYVLGAWNNAAARAQSDQFAGTKSSDMQYVGSFAVGAGTAWGTRGLSLPLALLANVGSAGVENIVSDRQQPSASQSLASALTTISGKGTERLLAPALSNSPTGAVVQGGVELLTQSAALQLLLPRLGN